MKKMILGCFLYGTAIGLYAQAPQGDFKGSIQIGQTTMPIVFHFGQQNGQPTTTMDSPAQGVFGFPVQSSECLSDGELTLKIPQIQFRYVGKVRGDRGDGDASRAVPSAEFGTHGPESRCVV